MDNPAVPLNDGKYDVILRAPFDVDEKWQPKRYIDGLDGPAGWDKVGSQGIRLRFNYPAERSAELEQRLRAYDGKKKIMLFMPTPRPNMSIPWEISGWEVANYRRLVQTLNAGRSDLVFFAFHSFKEQHSDILSEPNVVNLGSLTAYDEVLWFQHMDLLVSTSTSVSAMIAPLVETPQVVIHTCEENETPVWHGIPDKCVLPPLRFLYLNSQRTTGEVISFVKPEPGGKLWTWNFNNYFQGRVIPRKMRVSHEVTPEAVAQEVDRRLNNPVAPGREWFIPQGEPICKHCELLNKYGRCIYDFQPRLRNGKQLGEETLSVELPSASQTQVSERTASAESRG